MPGRRSDRSGPGIARVRGDRAASYHGDQLELHWLDQPVDHFHFAETRTYKQRYFLFKQHFTPGSPIFFYAGNEADVTMYVNATGLMWENAEQFKALLVFAEHRYYGASEPFGKDSWKVDPSFLTTEQALADFARLVLTIKYKLAAPRSPVIVFGGSYGGMLGAWLRMKYPLFFQGAIAASAPIGAFPGSAAFKPSRFWEVVTKDASPAAGAVPGCVDSVRAAFQAIFTLGHQGPDGRAQLQQLLHLCDPLHGEEDVKAAAYWLQGAFDAFAMGNYPYPSSYISGDPDVLLPAWPMRAACKQMMNTLTAAGTRGRSDSSGSSGSSSSSSSDGSGHGGTVMTAGTRASISGNPSRGEGDGSRSSHTSPSPARAGLPLSSSSAGAQPPPSPSPAALIEGLRQAAAVLYNASGEERCFSLATTGPAAGDSGPWDYQFCTELDGQEQPYYPTNGVTDMFWDQGPFDLSSINRHCRAAWNVTPRVYHAFTTFGGVEAAATSSNIVFSNGALDPWSVFGVLGNITTSPSIIAINIPNGAHHVDLMFSHDDDTSDIITARKMELDAIRRWVEEYKGAQGGLPPQQPEL